jgi:AraC-like DNA-binding protein
MNLVLQETSAQATAITGRWQLGDLRVTTVDGVGLSQCRVSTFQGDTLTLMLVKSGFITLKLKSGSRRLNSGSLFISDSIDLYKHNNPDNKTELISISIPKRLLVERGFVTPTFELIAANMTNPDVRAVGDLVLSIAGQNGCTSLALRERQGRHLLDLIAVLVGNPLAVAGPRPREVALSRAKNYVAQHLEDHDLNAARIATSVGISLSHLGRLFKARSTTVMRYIWSCRLERAADLVKRRGQSNVSIGEIAHSCGFSSHAHFSRTFKERFGLSPSDYESRASAFESGTTFAAPGNARND